MAAGVRLPAVTWDADSLRRLGGDGYIGGMTWGPSDQQFVAIIDGCGWPEVPRDTYYSSRLFALTGSPEAATFTEVTEYPDIPLSDYVRGFAPYYGLNALAVDRRIYQFLSTEGFDTFEISEPGSWEDPNFTRAMLIYSPDEGRTWFNQDGWTPVMRYARAEQSRRTMTFFDEPQDAFAQLTFLQMGRGYRDNRDGYVYVYAQNGRHEGTMNELVMFRVPKTQVLDRGAYEYFVGVRRDGTAEWDADIARRGVVHTFPAGHVQRLFPLSWLPSVVYNAPLGMYMMASCSGIQAYDCADSDPTYLGLWVADNPWGPWRQIHEEAPWRPGGDAAALAAAPLIAPKWISPDGKSFWLVWTDAQKATGDDISSVCVEKQTHTEWMQKRLNWRRLSPYFGFNAQRMELVV